jgi:hypothetical protein
MPSPFDHPEARSLFRDLLLSLTAESDRGAILIGAAQIDFCLRDLLEAVVPASISNKQRKALFEYPGALSSFATRNHVAYVTRLIPQSVYDATNSLRSLRNDVAHHPSTFDLNDHADKIRQVYGALGATLPAGLRSLSVEMIIDYKINVLLGVSRELRKHDPDFSLSIETRDEALNYLANDTEVREAMQKEIPRWELALGIALLCSIIIHERDSIRAGLGSATTLSNLLKSGRTSAVFETEPQASGKRATDDATSPSGE